MTRRFAASAHAGPLVLDAHPDGGAILARTPDGACMFFDSGNGRLCAVHRDLGEALLPSACRQFPRITLTDPRGRWITLSHFCPTAAALLFSSTAVTVVSAPASIALAGDAEGLDATGALPALLRPGMLMDFDGYGAWERSAVEVLCTRGANVDQALAALGAMTRVIQRWSPGEESLEARVARAFDGAPDQHPRTDQGLEREHYARALAAVPDGLPIPFAAPPESADESAPEIIWNEYDAVVRRYLAAKVFGCWWPYLGLDLGGVIRAIHVHASVLRTRIGARIALGHGGRPALLEAIRETDLLMVHLTDNRVVAEWVSR